MSFGKEFFPVKTTLLAALMLGGCIATTFPYMRGETAQRIAAPAWMIKRDIPAGQYTLRAYERIHDRGGFAHVYLAGDGDVYTSFDEWRDNPTPKNPVALHMASKDKADNVIYIAQPCQYVEQDNCDSSVWNEKRYSQENVDAIGAALDEIALRYDIPGFHIIGYSGGGAIGALLAAQRSDILSLRTVAGIMDHETQTALLEDAPKLTQSLNPVEVAATISDLPQYHFIGGQDNIVPPAVLNSYIQAAPPSNCIQSMVVQEANYDEGWVNKWPELLKLPVTCYNRNVEEHEPVDFGEKAEPVPLNEPDFMKHGKTSKTAKP